MFFLLCLGVRTVSGEKFCDIHLQTVDTRDSLKMSSVGGGIPGLFNIVACFSLEILPNVNRDIRYITITFDKCMEFVNDTVWFGADA